MYNISFLDESFDSNISSSYFLSIQITLDGFSFCTLDPIRNRFIQFYHQNWEDGNIVRTSLNTKCLDQFEKIINSESLLDLPFKKIFLLYGASSFSLVPSVLFASGNLKELFKLTHPFDENCQLLFTKVRLTDSYLLFPIESDWLTLLNSRFEHLQISHTNAITLEALSLYNKVGKAKNNITLSFTSKGFDIFAFSDTSLLMANHFDYQSDADFLYFFLFVFEQLKFTVDDTEVHIIGLIKEDSSLILQLRQFVKKVSFKQVSKSISFSYQFKQLPQYEFFSLFNLPVCVS
ncbi:MAG: DUF3822 family protein [Breznakibacter sp.]|nr:DUF3822 family protein [Breznakibacter sp.]